MKVLSSIFLGLFFGMPYAILTILITRCLNQDDYFYWLAIIMLFVGVLSLLLFAIFPSRKDKSE